MRDMWTFSSSFSPMVYSMSRDCIRDEDREDDLCGGIGEVDSDMPCVILSREAFVAENSSSSNLGSSRNSEKK
ncbi:hypothetical protein V2J09_011010 [Rumex salicifolius]